MKLLSKLLIFSLYLAAATAECGIFQRFASLSRSWMPKGIAATVASYWFMKPAMVKAQDRTYFDRLEKKLLFLELCKKSEFEPVTCDCLRSFEAARAGFDGSPDLARKLDKMIDAIKRDNPQCDSCEPFSYDSEFVRLKRNAANSVFVEIIDARCRGRRCGF